MQSREGSCVFAGSAMLSSRVLRDSHVASLLGMTNLKAGAVGDGATKFIACMALPTRKGHAASVRRQSRQRLRSERRYRRNRFSRFIAGPVRAASAFPRLPRRFAPRNDNWGAGTVLTAACFLRRCCAGRGKPLPYNASSMTRPCEITCVHPAFAG